MAPNQFKKHFYIISKTMAEIIVSLKRCSSPDFAPVYLHLYICCIPSLFLQRFKLSIQCFTYSRNKEYMLNPTNVKC